MNLYDRLKQEYREKIEQDKIKYPSLHESVITSMKNINSWNQLSVDDAIYLTVVIADETFDVRMLNNMFNELK